MPVITALENTGMSTSEEGLPINGSFGSQPQSAPLDEPRVFVFVEKKPNEGLGLYLVPFEDEPLTGLFVKTIVPGKSASRLSVFDPGDKIVTVNGTSLKGLSYRESTDFIRQCPGPNVKMGIIKHAIYKKEDLAKLEAMAVYRQSGTDFPMDSPGIDVAGAVGVDVHLPATRLSGNIPGKDLDGGALGAIEEPMLIQKSDGGFNVESTPDFMEGDASMEIDGTRPSFDIGGAGVDTNANLEGQFDVKPGDFGISGDVSAPGGGSAETKKLRKNSKGCRRSRSNPQLGSRQTADWSPTVNPLSQHISSSDTTRSRVYSFVDISDNGQDFRTPLNYSPVFRAGNPCAKAGPLVSRSEPRDFQRSYFVPLSDLERSDRGSMEHVGMIKSKSLDKLDEIMRNDPILRDDYFNTSPSSRSAQTQTDQLYTSKKRARRKRNDRPRSQILPPTFLQLPSVTWLPDDLESVSKTSLNEPVKVAQCDYSWRQHYPQGMRRRRSKEEQAQIVQRWIAEMIEHKKAQELRRRPAAPNREKSTKLKKKSRSVPEHAFRGKAAKLSYEHRHTSGLKDDLAADTINLQYPKLRHSGSDPSFKSDLSRRDDNLLSVRTASVSTSTSSGASPVIGERLSPSLQSRIRSLQQSFKENSRSAPNVQSDSLELAAVRNVGHFIDDPASTNQIRRTRMSNPDLPLISHLLSGNELDSHC